MARQGLSAPACGLARRAATQGAAGAAAHGAERAQDRILAPAAPRGGRQRRVWRVKERPVPRHVRIQDGNQYCVLFTGGAAAAAHRSDNRAAAASV
jgi:hypothetical protein